MQVLKDEQRLEPQGVQLNWPTLNCVNDCQPYLDVFDVSWFECPKFNVPEVVSPALTCQVQIARMMMGPHFPNSTPPCKQILAEVGMRGEVKK